MPTAAERQKKYRDKHNANITITPSGPVDNVTGERKNITPSYMKYLVDKELRRKMVSVIVSLDEKNLTDHVFFGIGRNGMTFGRVKELLEVTQTRGKE